LNAKPVVRFIVLSIPVIGNLVVGIYDFANRKYNNKEYILKAMDQDFRIISKASWKLLSDKEFILKVVEKNGLALEYASEDLRRNRGVVFNAVEKNGCALQYASAKLRGDEQVVLKAIEKNGFALEYASDELKKDKPFMLKAVEKNGFALEYASKDFQGDKDVVLAALKQANTLVTDGDYDVDLLFYASYKLKNNKKFMQSIVEKYSNLALQYASFKVKKKLRVLYNQKN
jgi:hypothetical protein